MGSIAKVTPTHGTGLSNFQPLLDAAPMENVAALKFLDDLVLTEPFNADRTNPRALLHNHCPDLWLRSAQCRHLHKSV